MAKSRNSSTIQDPPAQAIAPEADEAESLPPGFEEESTGHQALGTGAKTEAKAAETIPPIAAVEPEPEVLGDPSVFEDADRSNESGALKGERDPAADLKAAELAEIDAELAALGDPIARTQAANDARIALTRERDDAIAAMNRKIAEQAAVVRSLEAAQQVDLEKIRLLKIRREKIAK